MAPDPIIADPPRTERRSNHKPQTIVCEFCECKLSLRGRMMWRSEKAKAILDLDEEADRLRKHVATLETANATLTEEVKTLKERKPDPVAAPRRRWSVGDDE